MGVFLTGIIVGIIMAGIRGGKKCRQHILVGTAIFLFKGSNFSIILAGK